MSSCQNVPLYKDELEVLRSLLSVQITLGHIYINGVGLLDLRDRLEGYSNAIHAPLVVTPAPTGVYEISAFGDLNVGFLWHGNKVGAIKALRMAFGMGLKETKDMVELSRQREGGLQHLVIKGISYRQFDTLNIECLSHRSTNNRNINDMSVSLTDTEITPL